MIKQFFFYSALSVQIAVSVYVQAAEILEYSFSGRVGVPLYALYVPAHSNQENAPTILWIHGFARHSRCLLDSMLYFSAHGYNCIAYDLRGHGRSEGQEGHIEKFEEHCQDLCDVYAYHRSLIKNDLFLVAHSMGSIVALRTLQEYPGMLPLRAMVLASPGLLPHRDVVSPFKLLLARCLAHVAPRLPVTLMTPDSLCMVHDEKILARRLDEYLITKVTPNSVVQAFDACAQVMAGADEFSIPLHFLIAGQDRVVSNDQTLRFYDRLPAECAASCTMYPSLGHALINEGDTEQVYRKIKQILELYAFRKYS